jgi:hypothetical protein
MSIKGFMVLGDTWGERNSWLHSRKKGWYLQSNNWNRLTFKNFLNKNFFVIPLMDEFGFSINTVNESFSTADSYINSSSLLLNNQYMRDNEIITTPNISTSTLNINFSIKKFEGIRDVIPNPIQTVSKLYVETLFFLYKEQFRKKNMLKFKSRGKVDLFEVRDLGELTTNIENYQALLTQNQGDFKKVIEILQKRIDNTKVGEKTTLIDFNNKESLVNYGINSIFQRMLAESYIDFVGGTYFDDKTSTETINPLVSMDLNRFIQICNLWEKSKYEELKLSGIDTSLVEAGVGTDYLNGISIVPLVDYTSVCYFDSAGNSIFGGTLTGVRKSSTNESDLQNFEISISPNQNNNFQPTVNIFETFNREVKTTAITDKGVSTDKGSLTAKEIIKKETLGLTKTTFKVVK